MMTEREAVGKTATAALLALALGACSSAVTEKGNSGDATTQSTGGENGDPGVSVPVPMGLLSGDNLVRADPPTQGASPDVSAPSGGGSPSGGAVESVNQTSSGSSDEMRLANLMDDLFSDSGYFQGATIYVNPSSPKAFAVSGAAAQDPLEPQGVRVSVTKSAQYPLLVEVFCAAQGSATQFECLHIEFATFGPGDSQAHVHLTSYDATPTGQSNVDTDITYDTSATTQLSTQAAACSGGAAALIGGGAPTTLHLTSSGYDGCPCLNGDFTLTHDEAHNSWVSGPIAVATCQGASIPSDYKILGGGQLSSGPAYLILGEAGCVLSIADAPVVDGVSFAYGHIGTVLTNVDQESPLTIRGPGADGANIEGICTSGWPKAGDLNWKLTVTE